MRTSRHTLDPVSLTTCWNKLQAIVDEATATLLRTAFSRIVTDAWDFSCVLFDHRGEMIVQGRHGMPSFIGCLALAMNDFLQAYPPEGLEPGDSLVTTDPWIGASQVNDVLPYHAYLSSRPSRQGPATTARSAPDPSARKTFRKQGSGRRISFCSETQPAALKPLLPCVIGR
jgi:hypothetical protein